MKSFLKNLNLGAIVALLAIVGLTASWKNHESKLAAQWYEVNETSPTDSNREIVDDYPGGNPGAECALPSGKMCAVKIDLKSYTGPFPETLADAQSLHNSGQIEIQQRSFKTP